MPPSYRALGYFLGHRLTFSEHIFNKETILLYDVANYMKMQLTAIVFLCKPVHQRKR